MGGNWREDLRLAKYGFKSTKYSDSIPGPDQIYAIYVPDSKAPVPSNFCHKKLAFCRGGTPGWKEIDLGFPVFPE